MMTDADYVTAAGNRCPYCGSPDTEARGNVQADGREAWEDVWCLECGKEWRDLFRLVGYRTLSE